MSQVKTAYLVNRNKFMCRIYYKKFKGRILSHSWDNERKKCVKIKHKQILFI